MTAAPATLTYGTSSWNTAQAVTAVDDPDWFDERVTVRHTAASGDMRFTYAARTRENVTVRDPETTGRPTGSARWTNTSGGLSDHPSLATSALKATETPQRVRMVRNAPPLSNLLSILE